MLNMVLSVKKYRIDRIVLVGSVIIQEIMMLWIMFRLSVDMLCVRFIFNIVFINVCVVEIGSLVFEVMIMVQVVVILVVKLWLGVK